MLHFEIDSVRGVPAYRQIMDQVKYYIASSTLRPEDRLPSIRELARYLRVNPTTVVKAYNELAHEGVIEQRQGRGVFVLGMPADMGRAERRRKLHEAARRLLVEARQMGASGDEVLSAVAAEIRKLEGDESVAPERRG